MPLVDAQEMKIQGKVLGLFPEVDLFKDGTHSVV